MPHTPNSYFVFPHLLAPGIIEITIHPENISMPSIIALLSHLCPPPGNSCSLSRLASALSFPNWHLRKPPLALAKLVCFVSMLVSNSPPFPALFGLGGLVAVEIGSVRGPHADESEAEDDDDGEGVGYGMRH